MKHCLLPRVLAALAALALLSTLNSPLSTVFAQGPLLPPGPPAPAFKTLGQIEPRTPISSATNITQAGSYYLTTNVTVSSGDAITIAANNVTLDLNGFTISSTAASAAGSAILLSGGRTNVAIYNGHISSGVTNAGGVFGGSGFGYGIYYSGAAPANVRVRDVAVAGVLYEGIYLAVDNGTRVESCTVAVAGDVGILAQLVCDSTAVDCGGAGIYANSARDCLGESVGSFAGVQVTLADNCVGYSAAGTGLYADIANNCYGYSSSIGAGLYASKTANNCYGNSYGSGNGLLAGSANNCQGYGYGSGAGMNVHNANNCYGYSSSSATGILANYTANNCLGISSSGTGLLAATANNCYGNSSQGTGLRVLDTANSCKGRSFNNGDGVYSEGIALNCTGVSGSGRGLYAERSAQNCYGRSNGAATGLVTSVAHNCFGESQTGTGLTFTKVGAMCWGQRNSPFASNYVLGGGLGGATVNLP